MSDRPKSLTDEMKDRVARKLAADLLKYGHIEDDVDGAARDIIKCAREYMDGYEIAKALEDRCYWQCDLGMADALDSYSSYASDEISAAEKAWAAQDNPQPPFPVGSKILISRVSGGETGEITGIYDHKPATYLVKIDGDPNADGPRQSRRIVNFEDARAIPADTEWGV